MSPNELQDLCPLIVHHAREEFGDGVGSFTDKEYVLTCAMDGLCEFRIQDRLYLLRRGQVVLLPPHTPHTVHPRGRIRHFIVHFTVPSRPDALERWPLGIRICLDDQQRMRQVLSKILDERAQRAPAWEVAQAGMLAEVLAIYYRNMQTEADFESFRSKSWKNIARAIEFMQTHYTERVDLTDLCADCGLSISYFCRAFAEHTNLSPHEYLNRIRIHKAKELLYDPQLNCTQIAERVGFSSIHVFSKVFRRHEKLSPLQWARERLPWHHGALS